MKKLAIVGWAGTKKDAPWGNPDYEVWSLNAIPMWFPEFVPDKLFDIHPKSELQRDFVETMDWYRKECKIPTYFPDDYVGIECARKFPVDDICKEMNSKYFTSSFSWLVCYAYLQGFRDIELWGIELAWGTEYQHQRPCLEYWMGILTERGCKFTLPKNCTLLTSPWIYGIEEIPKAEGVVSMAHVRERKRVLNEQLEIAKRKASQLGGILNELDYHKKFMESNNLAIGKQAEYFTQRGQWAIDELDTANGNVNLLLGAIQGTEYFAQMFDLHNVSTGVSAPKIAEELAQ